PSTTPHRARHLIERPARRADCARAISYPSPSSANQPGPAVSLRGGDDCRPPRDNEKKEMEHRGAAQGLRRIPANVGATSPTTKRYLDLRTLIEERGLRRELRRRATRADQSARAAQSAADAADPHPHQRALHRHGDARLGDREADRSPRGDDGEEREA